MTSFISMLVDWSTCNPIPRFITKNNDLRRKKYYSLVNPDNAHSWLQKSYRFIPSTNINSNVFELTYKLNLEILSYIQLVLIGLGEEWKIKLHQNDFWEEKKKGKNLIDPDNTHSWLQKLYKAILTTNINSNHFFTIFELTYLLN